MSFVEGVEESGKVLSSYGGETILEHLLGDVPRGVEPWASFSHVGESVFEAIGRVEDAQVTGVAACVSVTRAEVYIDAIEEKLEGSIYLFVTERDAAVFERRGQRARVVYLHLFHAVAPYLHHLVCPGFDIGAHGLGVVGPSSCLLLRCG